MPQTEMCEYVELTFSKYFQIFTYPVLRVCVAESTSFATECTSNVERILEKFHTS